ncbi:energy transducer TonB [Croceicoccus gelatinilyticus]|uniref:energy transducer TonB n=1 Tax=Croceicoccus gelatinilyticus TaxID=2835536 RepID=UPI001BCEA9A8|nr:energy transducer TonB [Croceicoccus gelatinilyticus]MBS7668294.1 energy transducer TonB [Croceicoccus gelatinilyticus]
MKSKALATALGMVATGMASSASAEQLKLEKSSAWVMDYADSSCRLWATFGEGEQKSTLEFAAPSGRKAGFDVLVYPSKLDTKGLKFRWSEMAEAQEAGKVTPIKFEAGTGLMFEAGLGHNVAGLTDNPSDEDYRNEAERMTTEAGVEGLFLTDETGADLAYMTGSLKAPFNALRTCLDNLISEMGVDPVTLRNRSRPVELLNYNENEVLIDYPSTAIINAEQGDVTFILIVDEKGKPAECRVTQNLASKSLADFTCRNWRRYAKFTPALDADENPITGIFLGTAHYRLH